MQQPLRFRRIRVRIALSGWLYIAVTLAVGSAAVNAGNNLLYLITSGLLALMALSGMVAYRALRSLRLEVLPPREWFAGQETPVRIVVHNTRRRLPTYLLRIARGERETLLVEIPASGSAEGVLSFTFDRRGEHELGEVLVTSTFPFSLFQRGGMVRLERKVLVYPRPLPVPPEAVRKTRGWEPGRGSRFPGVGGDFRGTRPYQPGDSLSRISWKTWGRLGQIAVKQFEEDADPPLLLSLESVPGPSLEDRLGQLAGLILQAGRAGRPVGLRLPGTHIEPGVGMAHRERQLRALALYRG